MKVVRVKYTVTGMGADGKPVTENKERILSEVDSTDPKHVQQVLEQELSEWDQPTLGKPSTGSSLVVTNIMELQPTGDDDQM